MICNKFEIYVFNRVCTRRNPCVGSDTTKHSCKNGFDSILEQFNRRESVNDLGYLNNYIPIVIEDGKDMSVKLHPTVLRIPPSHHKPLDTLSVGLPKLLTMIIGGTENLDQS